jgi:hypothetical protein
MRIGRGRTLNDTPFIRASTDNGRVKDKTKREDEEGLPSEWVGGD